MATDEELRARAWRAARRRREAFRLARERLLAGDATARKALADKMRPLRGRVEGTSGDGGG